MGSERWTSAALSRDLRDAGLEQTGYHMYYWCCGQIPSMHTGCGYLACGHQCGAMGGLEGKGTSRAPDLTDVLDELTSEREGGPLCVWYSTERGADNDRSGAVTSDFYANTGDKTTSAFGAATDVEAAGKVLLQLLRERKERGPK